MKSGRVGVVIVLIVALVGTALTRQWAESMRLTATNAGGQTLAVPSEQAPSNMPSFALALLLGGLRGPLVMILWTSSETQKTEKNLEDFDTKVEWIRLLQPEFDSVHLFQIWNKAYNISVQMASLANKYIAILDAIEYGRRVEAGHPHDINIEMATADVYFNKLGTSTEKEYYRRRVREDTQWREVKAQQVDDPARRKTRLDPMLDSDGKILPQYLVVTRTKPANVGPNQRWDTGAELQYLKKYEPFPQGISTLALGYNYYQRAQVMQKVEGQRHIQVSPSVVDSRPAIGLRFWGEEEWYRGRISEQQSMGAPTTPDDPDQKQAMESGRGSTATMPLNAQPKDVKKIDAAIVCYDLGARVLEDAAGEYNRHLREEDYQANLFTYESHLAHVRGARQLLLGDANYLKAMRAAGAEQKEFAQSAIASYQEAIKSFERMLLTFYVDEEMMTKLQLTKPIIEKLSDQQVSAAIGAVWRSVRDGTIGRDPNRAERTEYERYIDRAMTRLDLLGSKVSGERPPLAGS